jgi:hypothetical protein
MSEIKPLLNPTQPGAPSLEAQLETLFTTVAQEAGAYVFDHPEQHCFNIVFSGQQLTVSIAKR